MTPLNSSSGVERPGEHHEKQLTLDELKQGAKAVEENPSQEAMLAVHALDPTWPIQEQVQGWNTFQVLLAKILRKVRDKGVKHFEAELSGQSLEEAMALNFRIINVLATHIPLNPEESIALFKLNQFTASQGEIAEQVQGNKFWKGILIGSKGGRWDQYKRLWDQEPAIAMVATVGVAFLSGLVFRASAKYTKKVRDALKEKMGKVGNSDWFTPGGILTGGGIAAAMMIAANWEKIAAKVGLEKLMKTWEELKIAKDLPDQLIQAGDAIMEEAKEKYAKAKEVSEGAEKEVNQNRVVEHFSDEEVQRIGASNIASEVLIGAYCLNTTKFGNLKPKITAAFVFMHDTQLSKIQSAYQQALDSGNSKISLSHLGIPEGLEVTEEAAFHAAVIISKAMKEGEKIGVIPATDLALSSFLAQLATDPAMEIGWGIKKALENTDFNFTSLDDIKKAPGKFFNAKIIDTLFSDQGKQKEYFNTLANDYDIDLKKIKEQGEMETFFSILTSLYTSTLPLKQSAELTRKKAKMHGASPELEEIMLQFVEKMVENTERIIPQCIERYDIKHSTQSYDQVLKQHLKIEKMHFRDGFQLVSMARNIGFESSSHSGSDFQMRDITMIYALLNFLEHQEDSTPYSTYAGNIINVVMGGKIKDLNPHFELFIPYFKTSVDLIIEKEKRDWKKGLETFFVIDDPNDRVDKNERVDTMNFIEFFLAAGQSSIRIPQEIVLTLYKNFEGGITDETGALDIMKMVYALGGTLIYSQHDGKNVGALTLLGKEYIIEPVGVTWDTIMAFLEKDIGTAAKIYILGTTPFIVFGAGVGGVRSAIQGAGFLSGALGGASRGAVFPVTALPLAYRSVRGGYRTAIVRLSPLHLGFGNAGNLEMSSRLFSEYNYKASSSSPSIFNQVAAAVKDPLTQAQRVLLKDIYRIERIKWANRFILQRNNFFALNPDLPQAPDSLQALKFTKGSVEFTGLEAEVERMRDLINRIKTLDPSKTTTKAQMLKLFDQLQSENLLNAKEKAALINRVNEERFNKFRRGFFSSNDQNRTSFFRQIKDYTENRLSHRKGIVPASLTMEINLAQEKASIQTRLNEIKTNLDTPGKTVEETQRLEGERGILKKQLKLLTQHQTALHADEPLTALENTFEATRKQGDQLLKALDEAKRKGNTAQTNLLEGLIEKNSTLQNDLRRSLLETREFNLDIAPEYLKTAHITDARVKNGLHEYKIQDKWIKMADTPAEIEAVKQEYIKELKRQGIPIEQHRINAKMLRFKPVLHAMMGLPMATVMIHHLETADDKRKALAEAAVGLGAFMGGYKAGARVLQAWDPTSIKGFLGKEGVKMLGGMAVAAGVHEPVMQLVEEFWPHFIGEQHVGLESISFMEKMFKRSVALATLRSVEEGAVRYGVEVAGMKSLGRVIDTKFTTATAKKITEFASKPVVKQVLKTLGARGVTMGALLADDAILGPLGLVTDVVAVGMGVWMAQDIIDITLVLIKAGKISTFREQHGNKPIAKVEPVTVVDKKALEAVLETRGKILEEMSDKELMEVIQSIPDIRVRLTREGLAGYEEYRFVKGEVWSITIKTPEGELIELSDEELNTNISLEPPKEFKLYGIDYHQTPEMLVTHYRLALSQIKSECGWTKLDYENISADAITIKRLDGDQSTVLKRSGEKWSVGSYKHGLTFQQAVVMANLINKMAGIFEKEGYTAGSSEPFHVDGDRIDFDKRWRARDLKVLSADTGWLGFYNEIGLSKEMVVYTLNKWHSSSSIFDSLRSLQQQMELAKKAS